MLAIPSTVENGIFNSQQTRESALILAFGKSIIRWGSTTFIDPAGCWKLEYQILAAITMPVFFVFGGCHFQATTCAQQTTIVGSHRIQIAAKQRLHLINLSGF